MLFLILISSLEPQKKLRIAIYHIQLTMSFSLNAPISQSLYRPIWMHTPIYKKKFLLEKFDVGYALRAETIAFSYSSTHSTIQKKKKNIEQTMKRSTSCACRCVVHVKWHKCELCIQIISEWETSELYTMHRAVLVFKPPNTGMGNNNK